MFYGADVTISSKSTKMQRRAEWKAMSDVQRAAFGNWFTGYCHYTEGQYLKFFNGLAIRTKP